MRRLALVVLILLVGFGLTACLPVRGTPGPSPYQGLMVGAINADRAAYGLAPLEWSPKLGGLAQGWSEVIAADGVLRHRDLASVIASPEYAGFWTLGENIAVAPAGTPINELEAAWMASPPHRANILNPGFNLIGVGFTQWNGQLWAVVDFGGA